MRHFLVLMGVVVTAGAATVFVQQPSPNLAGTWVATKEAHTTLPAAPTAVFGERFGLRMEGNRVAVIRPARGRATAITNRFPVDGTETGVFSQPRPCIGASGQLIAVSWEGDVLRYLVAGTFASGATTPTRSTTGFGYRFRSMTAGTLAVETTARDAASGEIRAVATVYRRTAEALPEDPPVEATPPVAPARIAAVAWIAGDWTGTVGTSNVEERWSTGAGGGMIATSRTLRADGVMSAFEFLCISERDGTLVYTAMPNAGPATDFTLTQIDAESATFENPAHSFPKLIRYVKRADGGLDAMISGGGTTKPTVFSFKRKQ